MIAFFYDSCSLILKFLIPGIFLGMVYDVFRLLRIGRTDKKYDIQEALARRLLSKTKEPTAQTPKISDTALVFIEDILFFLIAAVTEILMVYHINGGEIRIYGLLFSVAGFFLYQKTIGQLVVFLSKKILYLIRRILYLCLCLVLIPLFWFGRLLKRCYEYLRRKRIAHAPRKRRSKQQEIQN